jgi:hypothetical protein
VRGQMGAVVVCSCCIAHLAAVQARWRSIADDVAPEWDCGEVRVVPGESILCFCSVPFARHFLNQFNVSLQGSSFTFFHVTKGKGNKPAELQDQAGSICCK